jgi:hypothetical protein
VFAFLVRCGAHRKPLKELQIPERIFSL